MESIKDYLETLQDCWSKVSLLDLQDAVSSVRKTLLAGDKVLIVGNGGSSATASHFVNDWVKGLSQTAGKPIRALSLTDNTPTVSALANDLNYESIFSHQIQTWGVPGDTFLCISGSGKSKNIIEAAKSAKRLNLKVIGLIGFSGSELEKLCDISFVCNIDDMQIIEDMHMSFGHMVLRCS